MKSNLIGRRLSSMLCLVMSLLVLGAPVRAYDLTSTETAMTAHADGTIHVDGQPVSITAGQPLTYAQYVALTQSLAGGQTLNLSGNGTASSGTFTVSSQTPLTSLVIPVGVTGVADFSNSGTLNLTGDLSNNGTLYVVSTNSAFSTASISANNVLNGGLLTSVLPTGGIAGYSGALTSLSLTINALQNVINSGTISSAANLSVFAGNSIINALPTNTMAALPVMSAVNNLNLSALNVLNQGNITSALGNLNIETASLVNSGILQSVVGDIGIRNVLGSTMSIDNALGTISAGRQLLAEAIGTDAKALLDINGGVLSGTNVFLRTNDGHLRVSVADINGILDISTGTASLAVSHGTGLTINSFNITGDPDLIYAGAGPFNSVGFTSLGGIVDINSTGSITFTGLIDTTPVIVGAAGGTVSLVAGTTVTTQGITTTGLGGGAAGNVTISAGGNVNTGLITAPGANVNVSSTSGSITLTSPGNWDLGATNFVVNAGGGDTTIQSTGGNIVFGTGTITNLSAGDLVVDAANTLDLRQAIAAGTTAVNSVGAVQLIGGTVNMAQAGTLNLFSSGSIGGSFNTGTLIGALTGGVQFVGGGGSQTINFLGNGGEIRDYSPAGNYAGLNSTNLTVNSAGDILFMGDNFDNVGGSMNLNVGTSAFNVAQFDILQTNLARFSNITVNGGALGIFSDGVIQLSGNISTINPSVTFGGGMTVVSGLGCVNCPNTQTGIQVLAGADVFADRGPIGFYVLNTDTTTPADPSLALIDIAAGSSVRSVGQFVNGQAQGGDVTFSVGQLPATPTPLALIAARPTYLLADQGHGFIQFMPASMTSAGPSASSAFPSNSGGTVSAIGNGTVVFNDNGLTSLVAGTGSVFADGGYVFIGGASYAGEITINGSVVGSLPFAVPPPIVVDPPPPPCIGCIVITPPPPTPTPLPDPIPTVITPSALTFDVTRNPTATTEPASVATSNQQSAPTALPAGSGTIIAVACQRFVLERHEDDNSFVVAGGGTRFSRTASKDNSSPDELNLEEGKLMTLAGANGISMSTKQGIISLPAGAGALVTAIAGGGVAISSVNGGGTSVTIGGQTIAVNDGEQIVIGDSDEELIAVDDSAVITATVKIASKIVQTRKFDRQKMIEREKLLLCASGADTRDLNRKLKKKLDQVIDHMNKVAAQGTPGGSQSKLPPGSPSRFRGVAYITPVKAAPMSGVLNTVATATAHLRDMGNSVYTESADGSLMLESGDLLIQPSKKTTVHVGQASVVVEPSSMVLITKEGSTIKIANVWERQTGSARIHIGERFIPLSAGREAIITASSKDSGRAMKDVDVARRRIKESKYGGLVVTTADVSIHSLLRSDRVLNTLVRSTKSDDKAACDRIIKMAAVLTMATSGRGKYETAAGN